MKLGSAISAIAAHAPPGCVDEHPLGAALDQCGDLEGERIVILGRDITMMCELIRRGCLEVSEIAPNEPVSTGLMDFAMVPCVTTAAVAAAAIADARRQLVPSGRILIQIEADPSGRLDRVVERLLRLHGFSAIKIRRAAMGTALRAELPLFGPGIGRQVPV